MREALEESPLAEQWPLWYCVTHGHHRPEEVRRWRYADVYLVALAYQALAVLEGG